MILANENKCAMISDGPDDKGKNDQQEELEASNIIVEQIDGTSYTFDTSDCASMFKKFSAVYGSNFAVE